MYGDDPYKCLNDEHTFRIAVVNSQGIPVDGRDKKHMKIYNFLDELRPDVMGLTETNVCWKNIPDSEKLPERTRSWFQALNISSGYHYKEQTSERLQWGGTSIWSIDHGAHRIFGKGQDKEGLGRWSWSRYRGRNGIFVKVFVVYLPHTQGKGPGTAFTQQATHFASIGRQIDPIQALWEDLALELQQSYDEGDKLICMGDFNVDVRSDNLKHFFQQFDMREGILSARADEGASAPATVVNGSKPIDGIFMSPSLQPQASGYLPHDTYPSNHRAIWADFDVNEMFGHSLPPIVTPDARRLKTSDPRCVKRFQDSFSNYIAKHNLDSIAFGLQRSCQGSLTRRQKDTYEYVCRHLRQGLKEAENKCRKLKMGNTPWSPALEEAGNRLALWELVLARKQDGRRVSTRYLSRMERKCQEFHSLQWSVDEVKDKVQKAKESFYTIKKESWKHRETFLDSLAKAVAATHNKTKEKVLQDLKRKESQRLSARRIKTMNRKLGSKQALLQTQFIDDDGNRITVIDKDGVEEACLNEAKKRFTQANETPFLQEPLRSELGDKGFGPATEHILSGNYTPPEDTDQYAADLLKYMRKPPNIKQVSNVLTTEEMQQGWAKQTEQTSAGPSGIHFGNMKAIMSNPYLADVHATMANIPYATGYTPERWKKGTDVFIEKKNKGNGVDALRIILLYEADFNFNNKILGKKAMDNAEQAKAIAPEQYGSRKAKSAIHQVLNKNLTYDLWRQKKTPAILLSNDAKSCYDRMSHPAISLALQRMGIQKGPIESMLTALQELKHFVRTGYGDSERFFDCSILDVPCQGSGQGNGAGPCIWALISTPIFDLMRDKNFGSKFRTAVSNELLHLAGYAFVDDTDLIQSVDEDVSSFLQICEKMQSALDNWAGALRATGGALDQKKSFWYGLDFVWEGTKWKYSMSNEEVEIQFIDKNGVTQSLKRHPASYSTETLGVFLAPDGNMKAQIKHMRKKAEEYKDNIRASHLSRTDAWLSLHTTILKTIQYPIPALTLTADECKYIMAPIYDGALSASGYNNNMPRPVVNGPIDLQGLNIPNLFTWQGANHLEVLQNHLYHNTITGHLLKCSLELLQLEWGRDGSPFDTQFDKNRHYCTDTWLTHLWQFTSQFQISIKVPTPPLKLQRQHDLFLMDHFYTHYDHSKLRRLNGCRLYLQVLTLSDITTGDGMFITASSWNGRLDSTRYTAYDWPNQGAPTQEDWTLWKSALRKLCSTGRQLRRPLSRWLGHSSDLQWLTYFCPRREVIFRKEHPAQATWTLYFKRRQRGRTPLNPIYYHSAQTSRILPTNPLRCTIDPVQNGNISLTGMCQLNSTPREPPPREHPLYNQSTWEFDHIVGLNATSIRALQNAFRSGNVKLVSDGSFYEDRQYGTSATVIDYGGTSCIAIRNVVPGPPSLQSAFRSELAGLYTISRLLQLFDDDEGPLSPVTIACDGESALHSVFEKRVYANQKHFDIISATKRQFETLKRTVLWKHVKGHQDNNAELYTLDRLSMLNVMADNEAKEMAQEREFQGYHDSILEGEMVRITLQDGSKISSKTIDSIHHAIHYSLITAHWTKKGRFSSGSVTDIDHGSLRRAMKSAPIPERKFVTKYVSGWLGQRRNLERWGYRNSNICQLCKAHEEDNLHIIKCKYPQSNKAWNDSIKGLSKWLLDQDTDPGISTVLPQLLQFWRQADTVEINIFHRDLHDVLEDQQKLGWQALFEGFISPRWKLRQESYWQRQGSLKSAEKWAGKLIRKLWDIPHQMWQNRNELVQQQKSLQYSPEMEAINNQIFVEFDKGLDTLPAQWASLFSGTLTTLLQRNLGYKKRWIKTVDALRTQHGGQSMSHQREFLIKWIRSYEGR